VFLAKKYIQSHQNMVQYEKFLEDLESIFKNKYSHMADFKLICDYIRKACIVNQVSSFEDFLQRQTMGRDSVTYMDFEKALQMLQLIPGIC